MDRRQKKTKEAIFRAVSTLLNKQRFENITVQDIIEEADICRSTFYSHFETKDLLLKAMCSEIFDHIFEGALCDYDGQTDQLESKLAHILWHLKNSKADITGILSSQSSELFMGYLKEYLGKLFDLHLQEFKSPVPRDFLREHLVGSFAQTIAGRA